jgi:choline dehydrogenase-like flavoprotein
MSSSLGNSNPIADRVDVLVVGSGPLGTAVARRLTEQGRSVLILEQGPAISDPTGSHIRNAPRFRTDPDAYLALATTYLDYLDTTVARDKLPGAAVTKARGGQGFFGRTSVRAAMHPGMRSRPPNGTSITASQSTT